MTKIVPPELSSFTPAGKSILATMLLGRMAHLAMEWVKTWSPLWQGVSVTSLLKTIIKSIAWRFYQVILAAPSEKAKKLLGNGKELGRDESNVADGEKQNLKVGYERYLILNTLESYHQEEMKSLVEGGHFGEGPEQLLNGCTDYAELLKVHLEERHRSQMWLRNASIFIDFGTDSGDSSEDNMEEAENSSQNCLEGHNHVQESRKGLSVGEYFGKNGKDSCSHQGECKDLQECFWQDMESPSVSQQPTMGLGLSEDFVMCVEPSYEMPLENSKNVDCLEALGKDCLILGPTTASCGYKESLVQSLFYSPSEDDDDDGDDSEDWLSEDEMEDSSQSRPYVQGGDSGNGENRLEAGNGCQHQEVLENQCESFFTTNKPLDYSLSFSKPVQALKAPIVLPTPKQHKEITTSLYLRTESKPKEFCNGPKQSWPSKHSRSTCTPSAPKCCQPDSRVNCDPISTENPLISQEDKQLVKKVSHISVIFVK